LPSFLQQASVAVTVAGGVVSQYGLKLLLNGGGCW